mmetsp:Transcript_29921/g.79692  ORF Transcript_29921/g.79692 Transcript_29921/m.79692 type:complete len:214 (-) Transcript_29921:1216-1857(-)
MSVSFTAGGDNSECLPSEGLREICSFSGVSKSPSSGLTLPERTVSLSGVSKSAGSTSSISPDFRCGEAVGHTPVFDLRNSPSSAEGVSESCAGDVGFSFVLLLALLRSTRGPIPELPTLKLALIRARPTSMSLWRFRRLFRSSCALKSSEEGESVACGAVFNLASPFFGEGKVYAVESDDPALFSSCEAKEDLSIRSCKVDNSDRALPRLLRF